MTINEGSRIGYENDAEKFYRKDSPSSLSEVQSQKGSSIKQALPDAFLRASLIASSPLVLSFSSCLRTTDRFLIHEGRQFVSVVPWTTVISILSLQIVHVNAEYACTENLTILKTQDALEKRYVKSPF